MKSRTERNAMLEDLKQTLGGVNSAVVTHYRGLNVADVTTFRKKVKSTGGIVKVAKNTLAKMASKGTALEPMAPMLNGPVALVVPKKDAIETTKAVVDFAKGKEKFKILGGVMEGKFVDEAGLRQLAALPPKATLQSMLLSAMNVPATNLVSVLQAPLRDFVNVLKAREDQLSAGGEAKPEQPA